MHGGGGAKERERRMGVALKKERQQGKQCESKKNLLTMMQERMRTKGIADDVGGLGHRPWLKLRHMPKSPDPSSTFPRVQMLS